MTKNGLAFSHKKIATTDTAAQSLTPYLKVVFLKTSFTPQDEASEPAEPRLELLAQPWNGFHLTLDRPDETHEPEDEDKDAADDPDYRPENGYIPEYTESCCHYEYPEVLPDIITCIFFLVTHIDNEGNKPSDTEKV